MHFELKYKRVLYSGIHGPLGHAMHQLTSGDSRFTPFSSKQCNLCDISQVRDFFVKSIANDNFEEVAYLHLAAKSGGINLSREQPASLFTENMRMAMNVLQVSQELGIQRVIFVLSTSCYSEDLVCPQEFDLHSGPIYTDDFPYAYAKRMQEVLMRSYNKQFGMKVSCVLVNGIIGAKMSFQPEKAILPASLIRNFANLLETDEILNFEYDSRVLREYTHAQDLAEIILWCIDNQAPNSLLNIGNTSAVSVPELASKIALSLGLSEERIKLIEKSGNSRLVQSTSNREFLALANYNYRPINLAIDDAVGWYLKHEFTKGSS